MTQGKKTFLEWFGYSRKERRSTFILLIILLILTGARYLVPPKDIELEDLTGLLASDNGEIPGLPVFTPDSSPLFSFDPNTTSYDTLKALGFSEKQARSLMSYREKGGRLSKPGDIKKIYGFDEQSSARIIPYILIEEDTGSEGHSKTTTLTGRKKPERIDLNRCDSTALERLPGLGPVLSARIIKYRKLLGGFVSPEQLKDVYGMSEATYAGLEGRVFSDTSLITLININEAGFTELSRHPYLDRYDVQSILKYKELKGKVLHIGELVDNKILTADKAKKISPYLNF
ncbi:MAG: hypothetical protein C0408_03740 [Odoribacter sp.]|nr:hypothetical protein [Odoribacter sp.]